MSDSDATTAKAMDCAQALLDEYHAEKQANVIGNLEELEDRTERIREHLKYINDDDNPLEDIDETTGRIVGNLQAIEQNETDLEALEAQTGRVLANLRAVAALLDRDDIAEAMRKTGN